MKDAILSVPHPANVSASARQQVKQETLHDAKRKNNSEQSVHDTPPPLSSDTPQMMTGIFPIRSPRLHEIFVFQTNRRAAGGIKKGDADASPFWEGGSGAWASVVPAGSLLGGAGGLLGFAGSLLSLDFCLLLTMGSLGDYVENTVYTTEPVDGGGGILDELHGIDVHGTHAVEG